MTHDTDIKVYIDLKEAPFQRTIACIACARSFYFIEMLC